MLQQMKRCSVFVFFVPHDVAVSFNEKTQTSFMLLRIQAAAIIRAGATRQREIYYPLSQGLHSMAVIRPFMMDFIDYVVSKMML